MSGIRIRVDSCQKTVTEKIEGMNCTNHEWLCNGMVGGKPTQGFVVKTLSNKAAKWVVPGFEFDAEVDEFQGVTRYKVPKWMYKKDTPPPPDAQRAVNRNTGEPPTAPATQESPRSDGRRYYHKEASASYTIGEYEALFLHAHEFCKVLLGATATADDVSRVMATYLISAINQGLKVGDTSGDAAPLDAPDAPPPDDRPSTVAPDEGEQPSADLEAINGILAKYKLTDHVKNKGIAADVLVQWWHDAGESKSMFITKLSSELSKP